MRGGAIRARGAIRHAASLGLSADGFVAETCSTSSTAAFRLRALDENPGARSRDGLRHGLLEPERSLTDRFAIVGREAYLHCPNGLARTKLSNVWFDRELATISTVRTWNVVQQLHETMS